MSRGAVGGALLAVAVALAACGLPAPTPTVAPAATAGAPATVVLAEAVPAATPTPVATPAAGPGTILFASISDHCYGEQIYSLDVAGGAATRLTTDCDAAFRSPSWSPDGSRFAFIMAKQGSSDNDIYIMSATGGAAVRVTDDGGSKGTLAWSPDGSRIAYSADTADTGSDIFVVGVDGSGATQLTSAPYGDTAPAWSPDGNRIVFRSERDLTYEIGDLYAMDADGGNQTRLTTNEFDDGWPAFSPDGQTIVFASNRDDAEGVACWHTRHWCNYELYAMDADGGTERRLTTSDALELAPVWSPDGERIAFAAAPGSGVYGLYVIGADGSGLAALTGDDGGGDALSWSSWSGAALAEATAAPLEVMVTPTGRPTSAPSAYAIAPELARAAAQTYSVPVYRGFAGDAGVNSLGAPLGEAEPVALARQWFGALDWGACHADDSLMLWRGDTLEVAFLLQGTAGDGDGCYPDFWLAYRDTWRVGEPNNEGESAPAGYYVPTMGFGKVWRQIRDEQVGGVGLATTDERHSEGIVQRFEGGDAYYFADSDEVYSLFDRFRRVTPDGESLTRVWYRVQ